MKQIIFITMNYEGCYLYRYVLFYKIPIWITLYSYSSEVESTKKMYIIDRLQVPPTDEGNIGLQISFLSHCPIMFLLMYIHNETVHFFFKPKNPKYIIYYLIPTDRFRLFNPQSICVHTFIFLLFHHFNYQTGSQNDSTMILTNISYIFLTTKV